MEGLEYDDVGPNKIEQDCRIAPEAWSARGVSLQDTNQPLDVDHDHMINNQNSSVNYVPLTLSHLKLSISLKFFLNTIFGLLALNVFDMLWDVFAFSSGFSTANDRLIAFFTSSIFLFLSSLVGRIHL